MNTTTHSLVQKLWNYCNVLRDDGMSYGDCVETITSSLDNFLAQSCRLSPCRACWHAAPKAGD